MSYRNRIIDAYETTVRERELARQRDNTRYVERTAEILAGFLEIDHLNKSAYTNDGPKLILEDMPEIAFTRAGQDLYMQATDQDLLDRDPRFGGQVVFELADIGAFLKSIQKGTELVDAAFSFGFEFDALFEGDD